jgi:hypothetical protein
MSVSWSAKSGPSNIMSLGSEKAEARFGFLLGTDKWLLFHGRVDEVHPAGFRRGSVQAPNEPRSKPKYKRSESSP